MVEAVNNNVIVDVWVMIVFKFILYWFFCKRLPKKLPKKLLYLFTVVFVNLYFGILLIYTNCNINLLKNFNLRG